MYYGFAEPVIIAGPRNAHLRPLIPPLAILFSSLLARAPSVVPGAPPALFSRGPNQPSLAPRAVVSFSPRRRITLSRRRFVTSMRPFYNHYRFSQLDRGCAPRLSLSLSISLSPPFSFSFLQLFVSLVAPVYPRISRSRPEFRCSQLRMDRRRSDDGTRALARQLLRRCSSSAAQKTSRGGNLLPRRARARANIRSLRELSAARLYLPLTFDEHRVRPRALRLRDYANS